MRKWLKRLLTVEPAPQAYTPPRVPQPGTEEEIARRAELLAQTVLRHLRVASDHAIVSPHLQSSQFRAALVAMMARYEQTPPIPECAQLGERSAELVSGQRRREHEYILDREKELRQIIETIARDLQGAMQADTHFSHEMHAGLEELTQAAELDDLRAVRERIHTVTVRMADHLERQAERSRARMTQLEGEIDLLYAQLSMVSMESKTDALTGLHNLESFRGQIDIEIGLAVRRHLPLSLLRVDLNDLRAHRDAHGEAVAEELVVAFSALLIKEFFRKTDFVARCGEAAFAVLMSQTDLDHAVKEAQRWLRRLPKQNVETRAGVVKVSAAVGAAQLARGEDADRLVRRCEQALARARERGGCQLMVSPPPQGPAEAAARDGAHDGARSGTRDAA